MIEKTFTQVDEVSAPVMLYKGQRLAISLTGIFDATIEVQRLFPQDGDINYPSANSPYWTTIDSFTIPAEANVHGGDNCWYRAICSVFNSGSPVVRLKSI